MICIIITQSSARSRGVIRKDMQCFHVYLLLGVPGVLPQKNFENQECRRSHIRSFFKALKVSNLPELCLFAAVSEEKVPIFFFFFFLLNVFEHKIEVIMSRQICREVLNAYVDPEHQIATAFLRTSFEI